MATDNPLLAFSEGLTDADAMLGTAQCHKLGDLSLEVAAILNRHIVDCVQKLSPDLNGPISVERPLRVLVSSLLHRSAVLALWSRSVDPSQKIELFVHQPFDYEPADGLIIPRFAHPFTALCDAGFLGNRKFESTVVPFAQEGAVNDTSSDSLLSRVMMFPPNVLLGLVRRRMRSKLGLSRTGRPLPILGDSESLREILPHLEAGGWSPLVLKGVNAVAGRNDEYVPQVEDLARDIASMARENLVGTLSDIMAEENLEAVATVLGKRIQSGLPVVVASLRAGRRYAEEIHSRFNAPKDLLASAMSHPASGAFKQRANQLNMNVVLCEHGISKGLSELANETVDSSELRNCDHFLALTPRSEAAAKNAGVGATVIGTSKQVREVIFPWFQRNMTRRRLNIAAKEETVFHVSPLPFYGNQRPGHRVGSESALFNLEKTFVDEVYAGLRRKVFFKSYPTKRFPYQPATATLFPAVPNLEDVSTEDFRYLRSAADIIVTGTATSTLAWCLGANKPVIWWYSRQICPVAEDVIPLFESGLFCFNVDEADWTKRMHGLLELPIPEINRLWQEKADGRRTLLANAIFGPEISSGETCVSVLETLKRRDPIGELEANQ